MTDPSVAPGTREREDERAAPTDGAALEACPDCGGDLVRDESQAETHCGDCGRVVDSGGIDHGPEWRSFADSGSGDRRSRVGPPPTEQLHDRGLSTVIDWRNRDTSGRQLSPEQREQMRRLRHWDERFRTKDSKDRNLQHALGEIERMASALGLPDPIRETASVLYRRALAADMIRGRSIEGMATAALYAGTRMEGAPRSIDEVVTVSRVDAPEVKRAYRYIAAELDLEIAPPDPETYLPRFASRLDCEDETERRARELVRAAVDEAVHSGRDPVGIAAAALYAAGRLTGEDIVQAEVSEVSSVSTVTIRNRYTEILEAVDRSES